MKKILNKKNSLLQKGFKLLCGIGILSSASVTYATTIYVNDTADVINYEDNKCTLREAVIVANANTTDADLGNFPQECVPGNDNNDTIVIPAGHFKIGIGPEDNNHTQESGDFDLLNDVIITGAGKGQTIIDGNNIDRIFQTAPNASIQIENMSLENGSAKGTNTGGGAIVNYGTLLIHTIGFKNNHALDNGGTGGAIANRSGANLQIESSTFEDNSVKTDGGAIHHMSTGEFSIFESRFSHNQAENYGGAICSHIIFLGSIYIEKSSFDKNEAKYGGAILKTGNITLSNSTLSQNKAKQSGGAIYHKSGNTSISYSTIVFNEADSDKDNSGNGGAIRMDLPGTNITGTIMTGNKSHANDGHECKGNITSGDYNLFGDLTGCNISLKENDSEDILVEEIIDLNLENNGGLTKTHKLSWKSLAYDAGPQNCNNNFDQRNLPRPQHEACDIGAFEAQTFCGNGILEENEQCDDGLDDQAGEGCSKTCQIEDIDNDGVFDNADNCPTVSNSDQEDENEDGIGDACEGDSDKDGVFDYKDNCPNDKNPEQVNSDNDGIGDVCDEDDDGDQVNDEEDNCPLTANSDQEDENEDGIGDACEQDSDEDGVFDYKDNCPEIANADQADSNENGTGDACETENKDDPKDNDSKPISSGESDGGCSLGSQSSQDFFSIMILFSALGMTLLIKTRKDS